MQWCGPANCSSRKNIINTDMAKIKTTLRINIKITFWLQLCCWAFCLCFRVQCLHLLKNCSWVWRIFKTILKGSGVGFSLPGGLTIEDVIFLWNLVSWKVQYYYVLPSCDCIMLKGNVFVNEWRAPVGCRAGLKSTGLWLQSLLLTLVVLWLLL